MMQDTRPLPPGWITETDHSTGVPYYVPNPTAIWEDPRPQYYNSSSSSTSHGYGHSAPPPAINSSSYPSQPSTTPYSNDQYNVNSGYGTQQQYNSAGGANGNYQQQSTYPNQQPQHQNNEKEKGLLGTLMGVVKPQQNHGQQQPQGGYGHGSSSYGGGPGKNSLMTGAGVASAGAVAYKLFDAVAGKNKKQHGHGHGGGMGGGMGGMLGGLMGGSNGQHGHGGGHHQSGGGGMGGGALGMLGGLIGGGSKHHGGGHGNGQHGGYGGHGGGGYHH
ncbi:hypothetical protein JCM16303_003292 [Sporobolomyces ruberrimus]